ncbi:cell division protein FtsQ/DivIB [Magnetospira sp. QH-2]|uniref:cell division protein FtsQ/DivIB n=1 Tax=Magnetospira sp. (strain QH-2) TaxID=1288970 RepID=UPI0003E80C2E|nr:FtsQ-type POTRA domain-containing protein [Magnetospira sp. QH-2]CCQ72800.1 Putative Cell division protein FtsQ [Magnetospira sp. QH-2]
MTKKKSTAAAAPKGAKEMTANRTGAPRPRVTPWWRKKSTRLGLIGVVLGGITLGTWWTWHQGWGPRLLEDARWNTIAWTANIGLRIGEVMVEGRRETSRDDLLAALRVTRDAPILAFDPKAARDRVEALPWVRTAVVERLLPDTVLLRIEERSPLALWQKEGSFAIIDDAGEEIPGATADQFADLVIVVGEDAPAHTAGLLEILGSEPMLMERVQAAVRVGGRRWNLRLNNGIDVQLPEEGPSRAWSRLASYEKSHRVLDRDIKGVDLRLPDRLVVKRGTPAKLKKKPARKGRST